jgi:hypothetical protein
MEDPVRLWCHRSGKEYPPDRYLCPDHPGEELVPRPAAPAAAAPGQADGGGDRPRSVCWKCRKAAPNATVSTCVRCHESLVPPVLVVEFPGGSVIVRARSESVELGRAGAFGHVFARYPNVSRWHATASVDASGDAWLIPNPAAPNGTFVNGEEITDRTRIEPENQVRFATDRGPHIGPVSERVRQPHREPMPGPEG